MFRILKIFAVLKTEWTYCSRQQEHHSCSQIKYYLCVRVNLKSQEIYSQKSVYLPLIVIACNHIK